MSVPLIMADVKITVTIMEADTDVLVTVDAFYRLMGRVAPLNDLVSVVSCPYY